MRVDLLSAEIQKIAPIEGIRPSAGVIDFRPEATQTERDAAWEIYNNWVDPFEPNFSEFAKAAQFSNGGSPQPYWDELEAQAIASQPTGYYFAQIQNNVMSLQSVPLLIQRLGQIKATGFVFSDAAIATLNADLQTHIDPDFSYAAL